VTGGQQGQQLVGDVLIRDRLTVFVAGLHQQRKHVAALVQGRVGPCVGDERLDGSVETAPVPQIPPPRTQATPQSRRHQQGQADKRDEG